MQANEIVSPYVSLATSLSEAENITNNGAAVVGKRLALSKIGRSFDRISKGRLVNPIVPGVADYIMGVVYDRVTYAPGAALPANFKFFVVPSGQQSKTKADTNLTQASALTNPSWMNAVGLGFKFSTLMVKADIDAFLNTYYVEFYVDNKIYLEGQVD